MPKKLSKKRNVKNAKNKNKNKNKKQTKKAGMLKMLSKMIVGQSLENKLYEDIDSLMKDNPNPPKKLIEKKNLADFILKKPQKSNAINKYFKLKSEVYSIAQRISYLDVTNIHKSSLIKYLEVTLKRYVGSDNLPRVMEKLSIPFFTSSENNIKLAVELQKMNFANTKATMNSTLEKVNSRLDKIPQFTTTPVENGFVSVNRINSKEVKSILENAEAEVAFDKLNRHIHEKEMEAMQRRLNALKQSGGRNKRERKSRKTRKRIYA